MIISGRKALAADNLNVQIGGKSVLQAITFAVDQGEFVGIIGPNGAGKSTLLRTLRGSCLISAGEILVLGQPIKNLSEKQMARTIAYMQQEVNAGFGFTAREVVLAGRYPYLAWWQNERKEDYLISQKYMAFTGVDMLADKPVQQVSGGERQRILLAKVLTQETPIIFMDEPTASLDLMYQEEIFRYCADICKQGRTVLLVAHDIRLAAKFCSRLILLAQGKIVADGPPKAVITAANLEKAYGMHAAVFINKVTGNLDIHTYTPPGVIPGGKIIHIIGGGGSAGNIIRLLYEKLYRLSCGVLQEGDTDADIAVAFGIDTLIGAPFANIGELLGRQNREKIGCADLVVLGNLCYGEQNLDNLKAAFSAKKLYIIEDTPIEQRDFCGGKATKLYRQLLKLPQVTIMTSAHFIEKVIDRI